MQPRAKLFINTHGYWNATEYILWTSKLASEYKREKGLNTIINQGDFTHWIREKVANAIVSRGGGQYET